MNQQVEWKCIEGYDGRYMVSSIGDVKSFNQRKKGGLLKKIVAIGGYLVVNLYKEGKPKAVKIHRLVAMAFIENADNKPVVNHINNIRDDNRVVNLEWCTILENTLHSAKQGRMKCSDSRRDKMKSKYKGGNSYAARLVLNTQTGIFYESIGEAAISVGMRRYTLNAQLLGKNKSNTPFIFA